MKRFGRTLLISILTSTMLVSTVFAAPTLNELKDDKNKAEKELKDLEKKMTNLVAEINKAEQELVKVGQAIIQAEKDLDEAEKQEKEQYEAMKYRIVAMYENGNGSMISKIFEAGSIAEMLKQAENVQSIHEYDRKQLEEYMKTKEKIENLKVSLEKDMAAIETKQAKYNDDQKSLDTMIANLEGKIDNLEDKIQQAIASSNNSSSSNVYVPPVGTGGGTAIVAEAYKYLGVPYVWGGESKNGVDCSGLVLLAHKAIGVKLYHYSGSQSSGGKAVSRENAQPGDVVCYYGHVGIYIGDGLMIHAPQRGDVVKIVKVYGSPWFRRYW